MIQYIQESCGLPSIKDSPTTLFEDNAACLAQITGGYIEGDRPKHISPKFFYTHELQKSSEIDIQQIRSNDNLVDLFTVIANLNIQETNRQDWNTPIEGH